MKARVPSIGSSTQRKRASGRSRPNSSPSIAVVGKTLGQHRAHRLLGAAVGDRDRGAVGFQVGRDAGAEEWPDNAPATSAAASAAAINRSVSTGGKQRHHGFAGVGGAAGGRPGRRRRSGRRVGAEPRPCCRRRGRRSVTLRGLTRTERVDVRQAPRQVGLRRPGADAAGAAAVGSMHRAARCWRGTGRRPLAWRPAVPPPALAAAPGCQTSDRR